MLLERHPITWDVQMVGKVLASVWPADPSSRSPMSHGLEPPASATAGNGDRQEEALAMDGPLNLCDTQKRVKCIVSVAAYNKPYLVSEGK